ncbi:MAG TPA: L-histidine N(alpha)-methyltransferase [Acidimicrobiales bacterium]|nr:L-histidine N(alpha)-methyltransferase [Acidimicrobiales bacterium]
MSMRVTTVQRLWTDAEMAATLENDARRGLTATPKDLPPKWFYDQRGSELFDAITELPEYYPTRRERWILSERAGEIADLAGAESLVELGSGSATKTRILLDALTSGGRLHSYLPFDVCEEALASSGEEIAQRYPGVSVRGVVGDFERHLHLIPRLGRQLVAFLGGTIGNLMPEQRLAFLRKVRAGMTLEDHLLVGADLVKDPVRLVSAYDDPAGVTAEFNRNVLRVLNRQLDADFDPDGYEHVAVWDPDAEWIEMRLRARRPHRVRLHRLDLAVAFEGGEEMRTEVSAKFRPDGLAAELSAAGFRRVRYWTDPDGDFSLSLAVAC